MKAIEQSQSVEQSEPSDKPVDSEAVSQLASVFDSCIPGGGLSMMMNRKRAKQPKLTSPTDSSKS